MLIAYTAHDLIIDTSVSLALELASLVRSVDPLPYSLDSLEKVVRVSAIIDPTLPLDQSIAQPPNTTCEYVVPSRFPENETSDLTAEQLDRTIIPPPSTFSITTNLICFTLKEPWGDVIKNCSSDSDCDSNEYCRFGNCAARFCLTVAECPTDTRYRCEHFICVPDVNNGMVYSRVFY